MYFLLKRLFFWGPYISCWGANICWGPNFCRGANICWGPNFCWGPKNFFGRQYMFTVFCGISIRRLPRGPTRTHQNLKFWLTFKREFKREMMFVGKTHNDLFFSRSPTIFPSGWNERFLRPVLDAFTCLFILYQNFNSLPQKLLSDEDKRFLPPLPNAFTYCSRLILFFF